MGLGSFFKREKKAEESHIKISDDCGGCEKCVIVCPNNIFVIKNGKSSVGNDFACKRCRVCVAVCPNDCIEVS